MISEEHEEEVLRKYVLPPRSNRGVPPFTEKYKPDGTVERYKVVE
nr:hypothetical protein [Tanacetum cinerariifolium]